MTDDEKLSRIALEAKPHKSDKKKMIIEDTYGNIAGEVDLKNKSVNAGEDLDVAIKASKHSPKTVKQMVSKCGKLALDHPDKFNGNDGEPDFMLNEKAGKCADIVARPDGGKPVKTNQKIDFSELTKRLKRICKDSKK